MSEVDFNYQCAECLAELFGPIVAPYVVLREQAEDYREQLQFITDKRLQTLKTEFQNKEKRVATNFAKPFRYDVKKVWKKTSFLADGLLVLLLDRDDASASRHADQPVAVSRRPASSRSDRNLDLDERRRTRSPRLRSNVEQILVEFSFPRGKNEKLHQTNVDLRPSDRHLRDSLQLSSSPQQSDVVLRRLFELVLLDERRVDRRAVQFADQFAFAVALLRLSSVSLDAIGKFDSNVVERFRRSNDESDLSLLEQRAEASE